MHMLQKAILLRKFFLVWKRIPPFLPTIFEKGSADFLKGYLGGLQGSLQNIILVHQEFILAHRTKSHQASGRKMRRHQLVFFN